LYKAGVLTDMRRNMSGDVDVIPLNNFIQMYWLYIWNWNVWRMEGNIWPLNYKIIYFASKRTQKIPFFQSTVSSFA